METIIKPSKNKLTQGFSSSHPGYDFDDVPVKEYCASFSGIIIKVVNTYTNSWIANQPGDPFYVPGKKRSLLTEDYGNYLKLAGDNGITQLAAHFPMNGIIVKSGQRVEAGQVLGFAPGTNNDTGNSSGGHTHTEYRDTNGKCIPVQFTEVTNQVPKGDSMELQQLFTKYGVKDLQELDTKINEHCGTTWGDPSKTGGGYLATARREINELRAAASNEAPVVPGWTVNGLQVQVGPKTWNYEKQPS